MKIIQLPLALSIILIANSCFAMFNNNKNSGQNFNSNNYNQGPNNQSGFGGQNNTTRFQTQYNNSNSDRENESHDNGSNPELQNFQLYFPDRLQTWNTNNYKQESNSHPFQRNQFNISHPETSTDQLEHLLTVGLSGAIGYRITENITAELVANYNKTIKEQEKDKTAHRFNLGLLLRGRYTYKLNDSIGLYGATGVGYGLICILSSDPTESEYDKDNMYLMKMSINYNAEIGISYFYNPNLSFDIAYSPTYYNKIIFDKDRTIPNLITHGIKLGITYNI